MIDVDTGRQLGVTPLQRDVPRGAALKVRIGLDGHQALERSLSAETDAVVDVMLTATPKPAPPAPPTETVRPARKRKKMPVGDDGTLDPFSK